MISLSRYLSMIWKKYVALTCFSQIWLSDTKWSSAPCENLLTKTPSCDRQPQHHSAWRPWIENNIQKCRSVTFYRFLNSNTASICISSAFFRLLQIGNPTWPDHISHWVFAKRRTVSTMGSINHDVLPYWLKSCTSVGSASLSHHVNCI